ncbi:MAG: hypothetical protein IKI57_03555 [Clostridia bacterium]|nr:hypothetical protein [Clostridia bacterium]
MDLLLGNQKIVCLNVDKIPTPRELAKSDPRIIYVGTVSSDPMDNPRWHLSDAFLYTAAWDIVYAIKSATLNNNIATIELESHHVDGWNPSIRTLLDLYSHEIYVGTVVDISPNCGNIFYNTYAKCLGHEDRYIKEKGKKIPVKPKVFLLRNYPDLMIYRLTTTNSRGEPENFAFSSREDAFYKWIDLAKNKVIFQNIAPSMEEIKEDWIKEILKSSSPEFRKAFERSYSKENFLQIFWEN